jgi:GNAT superfamily N-acetyltransferase
MTKQSAKRARQPRGEFWRRRLLLQRGTCRDYRALARFHYAPGDPATWTEIWRCLYRARGSEDRVVAVAVLSYPTLQSAARDLVLRRYQKRSAHIAFINRHLRTISRVIVHPQFRGLGIASALVRRICDECPTRYVEAFARMGEAHPLFERGGMRRIKPNYFFLDRKRDGKAGG